MEPGDYFAEEQVATWGIDAGAHLFEFIVPMVPPSWSDPAITFVHAQRLRDSSRPTAVAVSILDVCELATDAGGRDRDRAAAALLSLVFLDGSLASGDQVASLRRLRATSGSGRGGPAATSDPQIGGRRGWTMSGTGP